MAKQKSFLGTGWAFPVQFVRSEADCGAVMASEVPDIEESLTILLSTRPGERVMRPAYGCGFEDLMFEPLDDRIIASTLEALEAGQTHYVDVGGISPLREALARYLKKLAETTNAATTVVVAAGVQEDRFLPTQLIFMLTQSN